MTDKTKIRNALERIDFHCQPGDDVGNVEWWVTVNGECKGGTKIGHGSIIMRAFMDWKRARDEALALLDAERPSVPMEPLRLLYNMAALNGKIPDNRDEIITAHMAEFGIDVKG